MIEKTERPEKKKLVSNDYIISKASTTVFMSQDDCYGINV